MHQKLQKYSNMNIGGFKNYNGLKIFGLQEEHEIIFNEFIKLNPNKKSKILILGAGTGAFDQRLIDSGYSNITSTDFLTDNYKVNGTIFFQYDLNKYNWDFADTKFDYIFAIEVIEHIENQFQFLRNIKKILNKDGVLFISTPNITNQYSKANFIIKGQLTHFSYIDLYETGHIQIIAPHIFKYNYESNGFKLIKYTNEGKYKLSLDVSGLRPFIGYFVYRFIMFFLWGNKNQIDIYILKILDE